MKYLKAKNNRGFVLLFTMVLSAVLLSMAIGASSVALKELKFSTSGRDTNDAFFAADTGADCALYFDQAAQNKFPLNGSAGVVSCANASANSGSGNGTTASYNFTVNGLGSSGNSCVKVNVSKDASSGTLKTTITTDGYSPANSPCTANSTTVNRHLVVTY